MTVAIVIIAVCWKQHKQGPDAIKTNPTMTVTVLLPEVRNFKVPVERIFIQRLFHWIALVKTINTQLLLQY